MSPSAASDTQAKPPCSPPMASFSRDAARAGLALGPRPAPLAPKQTLSKAELIKAADSLILDENFDPKRLPFERQRLLDFIEPMIAHGALNEPLFGSCTALTLACEILDHDLIKTLLSAGADVNAPALDGQSPLMQTLSNSTRARQRSKFEIILPCMDTLIAAGAEIHHRNELGQQAIHKACLKLDSAPALWLLAHGADPSAPCSEGATPLHYLAKLGDAKKARLFIEAGADLSAKAMRGDQWLTPLEEAIRWRPAYGNEEVIALLTGAQNAQQERLILEQIAPPPEAPGVKPRPGL